MIFLEPSDQSIQLSFEDRKFIFEEWKKLSANNKHWQVYEILGMEPNTQFKYNTHSDPNFNYHFADSTLFPFGIEHSDDALLILGAIKALEDELK